MTTDETAYGYGREKLWQAVHSLATGTGSIQERLASAATFLMRLQRPAEQLPKKLHDELQVLMEELTKTPAEGDEGSIGATTRLMGDEEGSRFAERIFDMYVKLRGGM